MIEKVLQKKMESLKQAEKKKGKDLGGKKKRIKKGFLIYLETKKRTGLIINSFISFK